MSAPVSFYPRPSRMELSEQVNALLTHEPWVFVCIGSDRSTGDAFGPLVGSELMRYFPDMPVYGSLDEPVHALNLESVLNHIASHHPGARIFAVDAALGEKTLLGTLTVAKGPVFPGRGVEKNLPAVGDAHLTAVVNLSGWHPFWMLQHTRLSHVWKLARHAAGAMALAWARHQLTYFPDAAHSPRPSTYPS
ncbi:MAG: Spore protease GPR related protein [Candidatus Carbobacillus altaicus]|uniref:Spore protease GPR related protein n=1 Tax=Candidatus Carbonibacillus altaicus TaxID=2163959 RepID=A0A2R6XY00_9BACL|nr:MAG: Spore protease GPR related protein [Candidatus Carbobacillus altaicus]